MSSVDHLPWETSNILNFSILDYQFTWADKKIFISADGRYFQSQKNSPVFQESGSN